MDARRWLTDSKLEPSRSGPGSFPGGEATDLFTFQFFEGSNEEIMGSQQMEEVLW